jgi:hypothetical protein
MSLCVCIRTSLVTCSFASNGSMPHLPIIWGQEGENE